ncbi:MAG: hypothetical protein ABII00_09805 [Elusimicrobiota bacterium]
MTRRSWTPAAFAAALALSLLLPPSLRAADAGKSPCPPPEGEIPIESPFAGFNLTPVDKASLAEANIEVGRGGTCLSVIYIAGGSASSMCQRKHIRAAFEAICAGRERHREEQAEELEDEGKRLISNLKHRRLDESLIDRYEAFVENGPPEGLKGEVDEAFEGALITHMGRRKFRGEDEEGEPDPLQTRAQGLWIQQQDQDCIGNEECFGQMTGRMDALVEENAKTLRMQAASEERQRKWEREQAKIQELQEAKDEARREHEKRCSGLRSEYKDWDCANVKGKMSSIGAMCRGIEKRLEENGCD